jgi:phosphatidylserine decarboxylase
VKGIAFSLEDFLGVDSVIFDLIQQHKKHNSTVGTGPKKHLYYCVIYLAPGDYHGYHSPVDWSIKERIHFPGFLGCPSKLINIGYLYPVASWAVNMIKGLFAMNERVVLVGEWEHGFFSFTPVGAYNVGSMTLKFEDVRSLS